MNVRKDIEALIAEKFNGFVLPRNTADEIIDKYGIDCVEFVLANTVTHLIMMGGFRRTIRNGQKALLRKMSGRTTI